MIEQIGIAAILGVVEGFTEFLPISSTGHLILVNKALKFTGDFANRFDIIIQLGAILAVIFLFRKKLVPNAGNKKEALDIWGKIIVAVLPALFLGALFGEYIQAKLFNVGTVAVSLFAGGVILLLIERNPRAPSMNSIGEMSLKIALLIGLIQCIAMIPGVSRAGATIVGGLLLGASRKTSAEFSFFLAIPTLAAATGYELIKAGFSFTSNELIFLGVGFAVSFFTALIVVAGFIKYISAHDFKIFGWYRIALGLVVLSIFL